MVYPGCSPCKRTDSYYSFGLYSIVRIIQRVPAWCGCFALPGYSRCEKYFYLFWIRLSKAIYSNEKLRSIFLRLSKWIFIIYVFHELTLSSVRKICQRLFPATPLILCAEYLMIPILGITGCIIAGIVLKKIMPRLYIVLTGER